MNRRFSLCLRYQEFTSILTVGEHSKKNSPKTVEIQVRFQEDALGWR